MNTADQLYRNLEEMLELDAGTLKGDETLSSLNWDSMAVISFIALADGNFGASVPVSKLKDAQTVGDLWRLVADPAHTNA